VALALTSSLCSLNAGVEYFCKSPEAFTLLQSAVFDNERDSVSYRFGIAIFQKISFVQPHAVTLYKSKALDWAKEELRRFKLDEHNHFQAHYLCSLIYNLITGEKLQTLHISNPNP
jgi:hypothetical protein